MRRESFGLTVTWGRLPAAARLLLFGAVVVSLGMLSAEWFRPVDSPLAVWWPVAGVGTAALLLATRRQWIYVLGVHLLGTAIANVHNGLPWRVAALLGVANALEILVVASVLGLRRPDPRRLHDAGDLMRLVAAVTAGAATIAALAAAITGWLVGANPLGVAASLWPSHVSALLLVTLIVMRGVPTGAEARRPEQVAQLLAVTAVAATVFAPGQRLPLAILLFPVLLWTSLRSGVRSLGVQLVAVLTYVAVASLQGWGPYAAPATTGVDTIQGTIGLVQLLAATLTLVTVTVLMTVSSRRHAAAREAEQTRWMQQVFEQSLVGIALLCPTDDRLPIVEANPTLAQTLGCGSDDLVGRSWLSLFDGNDAERISMGVRAVAAGRAQSWQAELPITVHEKMCWIQVMVSAATGYGPEQTLLMAQMLDVTAQRDVELHLTDLAMHDPLTGLANRLLFDDRLHQTAALARRTGEPYGLLVLDLDGFKRVNDRFGHAVGDRVLVTIAERLRGITRDVDTVARLGGDEFVVLCPDGGDRAGLDALARRMQDAISQPIVVGDERIMVGVSVGIEQGAPERDPHELLQRADADMYVNKRAAACARTDSRA
ncbi:diguanylate cyclase domain-containing protein [Egicoccus sp. AB-alg6-2]|uniref:diguanylate cyclase domain-containing protein n=1 Tax=Egicoccus sp. AB-alg6-2 TaxID=3242692 RepID=UPI00359DF732